MKKRMHKVIKLYLFLIFVALLVIFVPKAYHKIKVKATSKVIDEVVMKNLNITTADGKQVSFEEVYNDLEPQDQKKVDELIDEYANTDTVKEVSDLLDNGVSEEEALEYVQDKVDPNDVAYLEDLYQRYYQN